MVDDDEPPVLLIEFLADDVSGIAVAGDDDERFDQAPNLAPELLGIDGCLECGALDQCEEHTDRVCPADDE